MIYVISLLLGMVLTPSGLKAATIQAQLQLLLLISHGLLFQGRMFWEELKMGVLVASSSLNGVLGLHTLLSMPTLQLT